MAIDRDALHRLQTEEAEMPELDLSWLDQTQSQWGIAARPGKRGLTLDEINVGAYGDVPAMSTNETGRPRGAAARTPTLRSTSGASRTGSTPTAPGRRANGYYTGVGDTRFSESAGRFAPSASA